MTITPTVTAGGVKSNSIPSRCEVRCDVRTLPDQDKDYVRAELYHLMAGLPGVSIELAWTAEPSASPHDTEFAELVRCAACIATGRNDLTLIPAITTGFTDSRWVRRLGTTVYGFPMFDPTTDLSQLGAHRRDESIDVATLVTRTRFHVALAWLILTSGERSGALRASLE
jgi:acetylornithine deacetylase/succinyl-diaminopimelate desuccinylase-like protein